MPTFEITAPDGKKFRVEAPEGATSDQAMERVKSQYAEPPSVGQGNAALEGALSGASAGFRDEIYGASEASGLPRALGGFRAPIGAARMAYEHFTEPGEATATYERARDEKRAIQKQAQEEFPTTFLAGQVAGGVALPAGAAVRGGTLGARALRSAIVGAGYGGATGFGEGEGLADSATKAAVGAPLGAAIGAVAPPLVEGAIQGARAISRPVTTAVRDAFDPAGGAARRIVSTIERDTAADPAAATRLTPQEFAATPDAAVMDLGGGLTRRLADVANITSPEGSATLNRTINNRFEGQTGRINDWLNSTFNFPNAHAQQQAIDQVEQTVNRAGYRRAYTAGDRPIWSPELERLTSSPDVVDAMRNAATKGKSRAVTQGFGGFNPGVTVDNGGIVTFQRGPNGVPTYPNLQFWDYTKRAIDDAANAARRSGRNEEASTLGNLSRSLRTELDRNVPEYAQARAGAAHFFGAENALEAGQNFVTSKLENREARDALARMTPNERQLFQDGFVSRFVEGLNEVGNRRNVLNQIAQSPAAQERLSMVMGPQRAREMEAMLRIEGIMDLARPAVQGNSWTARRLYDLGLASGTGLGSVGTYNLDPKEMTAGAVIAALSSGGKRIDQRVMRHVADMLVSHDPQVLARGLNIVTRNHNFMDALRATDARIARIGVQQVPPIPALQSGATSRADEDQPSVPRPPSQ